MKENRLIPKRRFKEFENDEAWEQSKFSELVNRISISSESEMLPRVEYEDIISGQGTLNKDLNLKENNKKGNEFKDNDILFGYLRPYLDNRLLAYFNGIAVGDWWVLRSQNCDVNFIYSLIQTQKFQSIANLSTGTKMPRASWGTVVSADYLVPFNIIEQKKIGDFFNNLDNLITLHQRKLKKIKETKSAYLSEIFPKEGEKYPKRRFGGFTDPWEQRKLGELFNFQYGEGNTNPSDGGKYTVYGAGGQQGFYSKFNAENSIIIGHMGDAGCVTWGEGKHFVTYNGMITTAKINDLPIRFGYYLLLTSDLRKLTGGSSLKFLTYEMIREIEAYIPQNFKERIQIAELLNRLDNLITLHQRKLEKLENIKKAYLNEMFV